MNIAPTPNLSLHTLSPLVTISFIKKKHLKNSIQIKNVYI